MTFRTLARRTSQMVKTLSSVGIGLGDRIACWSDISLDVLPVFTAAAQIGAVFVPLDGRLGAEEALSLAAYLRPRLLISERSHGADAAGVSLEVGALSAVLDPDAPTLSVDGPGAKTLHVASSRPADPSGLENMIPTSST